MRLSDYYNSLPPNLNPTTTQNVRYKWLKIAQNTMDERIPFMKIFNRNLIQQNEVFKKIMNNMDTREKMKTTRGPCDRSDPLFFQ